MPKNYPDYEAGLKLARPAAARRAASDSGSGHSQQVHNNYIFKYLVADFPHSALDIEHVILVFT